MVKEMRTRMSENKHQSFLTLPVELIHCIMDKLDLPTIFLSLRNVCQRLNCIVDCYQRYRVSIRQTSDEGRFVFWICYVGIPCTESYTCQSQY